MKNGQVGRGPGSKDWLAAISGSVCRKEASWFSSTPIRGICVLSCALLVFLFAVAATPLFAKVTGSISGIVRDPQGAIITGASVQLRNVQTGVIQTITSDSAGFYSFPAVDVGTYDITFQKSGFAQFIQTDV